MGSEPRQQELTLSAEEWSKVNPAEVKRTKAHAEVHIPADIGVGEFLHRSEKSREGYAVLAQLAEANPYTYAGIKMLLVLSLAGHPIWLPMEGTYTPEETQDSDSMMFDASRFVSMGILDGEAMAHINRRLDVVELHYGGTEDEEEQKRLAIAMCLREGFKRVYSRANFDEKGVIEARAGQMTSAQQHVLGKEQAALWSERMVLVAGMLGIPTSEGDLLLMVGTAGAGYVIVKAGKLALKKAPMFFRKLKSPDEVITWAKKTGNDVRVLEVEDETALRAVVAGENGELPQNFEALTRTWPSPSIPVQRTSPATQNNQTAERVVAKSIGGTGSRKGHPLSAINPTGSETNCVNCAIALDATLDGRRATALPGPAVSLDQVPSIFGKTDFDGVFSSITDIEQILSGAGPGARGVVVGVGPEGGHAFNAVNQAGVVKFLDGQRGVAQSLEGFTKFYFLKTAP